MNISPEISQRQWRVQKFHVKLFISELLSSVECKGKGERKDNRRGNKSLLLNAFSSVEIGEGITLNLI